MKKIIDGEELEIPTHVAIIMDGNGRWAKKRLLPRNMGHRQGAEGVGADLPGCSGFGNPVSDGVCIFHGELEAFD